MNSANSNPWCRSFSAWLSLSRFTRKRLRIRQIFPQRDGSHDFDFLIGDWKAHVRRLPDRLNKSNVWIEYDGISNHKKLLDSNANFEEFDVTSTDKKLRIKAQTLRLYNPASHSGASIWLTSIMELSTCLPWSACSPGIAVSFSIRRY